MKSKELAIKSANAATRKTGDEYFVVKDPTYDENGHYHVASAYDLDTFFLGCNVLYSTFE